MKKILMAAGFIYLFAAAGCKKGYLDINTNPNNPAGVSPELVLPTALSVTAARQINAFNFVSAWMGQWAVSGSYAPSTTNFSTYKQTTDFGEGLWATIYNNLEDYQYVEVKGAEQAKPFYQGTAKIMKAYEFQQLVDMFGNVPYFGALQGTANIQPAYDDAQAIYEDLISQIDSGINYVTVSAGVGVPTGSDIMFNGNVDAWTRFANSLKLRILLRQTEMAGRDGYIQSHIADIHGGFLEEDADVNPGYINTAGKTNPFWGASYNTAGTYINDFWRANKFGLAFYEGNGGSQPFDPRAHLVYGPTPGNPNLWQGNDLGSTSGYVGSASSIFGPGVLKSVSQPAVIMLKAESYFLEAEAILRGYMSGDAEEAYDEGIEASFEYYGADGASDYYSKIGDPRVYWDDSKPFEYKLNLIISQKWAAENTVTPFEVWCDYRRLPNSPFNKSIPLSVSPYVDIAAVPVRILYVTSEYGSNGANVPDQDASNAHHNEKIFWMP